MFYIWRAKEADLRMARMINNLSVKLSAVIEDYQLFAQELEASPALEREVGERADEKLLFIEKLKGN
ncbi:hypothetical protein Tco_1514350, partial [Tanacetum coccineum]